MTELVTEPTAERSIDSLLRHTTSLCGRCKRSLSAELWRVGDQIILRKRCAAHGPQESLISSSAAFYDEVMSYPPLLRPPTPRSEVTYGCPFDCGPCTAHEQRVELPIVPITSACNLDCPICYTHNRNDGAYHMSEDELRKILAHLRSVDLQRRIINITGGEPTQHPAFEKIIELCRQEGIQRITVSTHGLRFLKEEQLLEKLAQLETRIILSFDSLQESPNQQLLGGNLLAAKLRVLSLLEKYKVHTTLLPVLARGINDHEVGELLRLALAKPFIRSIELHTMTFTGQSGEHFDRAGRYTTWDVLCDIEKQTGGLLRTTDFVPSPTAHPLCYLVTYVLTLQDGRLLPFPRFMSRKDLHAMLGDSLYLSPGPNMEQRLQDIITRLYAGEIVCEDSELVLATLKDVIGRVFSPGLSDAERLAAAESCAKAVYVHSHMDADTFDTDRIRACCVGIREPDGRNIPSCAYNVLYRNRDTRFTEKPAPPLVTLGLGRR